MAFIALRRLWNRPLFTLLSIIGVVLAVGLVTSIPILSQALSFRILQEEMNKVRATTGRPLFSMRVYTIPSARYPLSVERTREWAARIEEVLVTKVGLPVLNLNRRLETASVTLRARGEGSPYGEGKILMLSTTLAVLTGVEAHMTLVEGKPMATATSQKTELNVWMYETLADEMGIQAGETYEVSDPRGHRLLAVRIAGTWRASDPRDGYWQVDPDITLRQVLLAREDDYQALAEPAFDSQLGFASWSLVMDDRLLVPDKTQTYVDGLQEGIKVIAEFVPSAVIDSSPLAALDTSIRRDADLTALLFVFSVPLLGCLLYFLALISTITVRWQQREMAVMVSRGMCSRQLLIVGAIEGLVVVGIGCSLGILCGSGLAQAMGYTRSFLSFTWREALSISPMSFNVPMVAAAAGAALIARLAPIWRAARSSVVEHERERARALRRPFWQRAYLDVALLLVALYARDRLARAGTLVPAATGATGQPTGTWLARLVERLYPPIFREQDPLLFLVPALFALSLSLLLVRLFPLVMRAGDRLCSRGGESTFYLAFCQLARQSDQYTHPLLLVITALSLGTFMASMAESMDKWLIDRVYYAIGSDVLLRQMPAVTNPLDPPPPPTEGAWVLPAQSYEEIPGILHAARVALYPAVIGVDVPTGSQSSRRAYSRSAVFIGIDRLDLPAVLFDRADLNGESLGEMMNRLARREDGVIVSEQTLADGGYEIGDKIRVRIYVDIVVYTADLTIVGTFKYFPTVYEARDGIRTVIGNLEYLYEQIGATFLHHVWLKIDPASDPAAMRVALKDMGVWVNVWLDTRDEIAREIARVERVGIFGVLTVGFLGAAALSAVGFLVYNYASLQERLFRFTVLRAVGLSPRQLVGQLGVESLALMVYSVAGGAGIGALASRLFIPFFQAADAEVLNPPRLLPLVAWGSIARISAVFAVALLVAQMAVVLAAVGKGVFEALRMGDRE